MNYYELLSWIISTKAAAAHPLRADEESVDDAAGRPLTSSGHHHLGSFQQGAHKPKHKRLGKYVLIPWK